LNRKRPEILSLLAAKRPAARRVPPPMQAKSPAPVLRVSYGDGPSPAPTGAVLPGQGGSELQRLLQGVDAVRKAAAQLRICEAVLDQVGLLLVELDGHLAQRLDGTPESLMRESLRRWVEQIDAALDLARYDGRRLFSGGHTIDAVAAGMDARLELPAMDTRTLGDSRIGLLGDVPNPSVATGDTALSIVHSASAQIEAQRARVGLCAGKVAEMIQVLEIALEMHGAAASAARDTEFTQAVSTATRVDIHLASRAMEPPAAGRSSNGPALRVRHDQR